VSIHPEVITVRFYQCNSGEVPFKNWYDALKDKQTKIKIQLKLSKLRSGNLGDAKSLGNGLHELRIQTGPGYRIYFTYSGKEIIVIFSASSKRGQDKAIQQARKYLEDYRKK